MTAARTGAIDPDGELARYFLDRHLLTEQDLPEFTEESLEVFKRFGEGLQLGVHSPDIKLKRQKLVYDEQGLCRFCGQLR